jgi:hypothetical protein
MDVEGKDWAGLLGFVLTTVASVMLWIGLIFLFRFLLQFSLEKVLLVVTAALLVLGSWLIIRALAAVDR